MQPLQNYSDKSTHIMLIVSFVISFLNLSLSKSSLDYKAKFALAQAHYERVRGSTVCSLPLPRVFKMGTPEVKLVPSATILHRCGDTAGCCDFSVESCVANTTQKLKLYFFVKSTSGRPWRKNRRLKVTKRILVNHTSCHCVDKRNIPR